MIKEQFRLVIAELFRGNGWTIANRLVEDYCLFRKDESRRNSKEIPYVDKNGYLYISADYILHIEAWTLSKITVKRWLTRMNIESIDGNYLIHELQCDSDEYRIKLNHLFITDKSLGLRKKNKSKLSKSDFKNQQSSNELSKLQNKFNRKWHGK